MSTEARGRAPLLGAVGPCVSALPLPLPARLAERARREVNEDPATAAANLRALRQRVLEESNLHSRTDDTFLLAFLRARKHDVEEAFKLVKNFYQVRKQYPLYTEQCLPSDKGFLFDMKYFTMLADRDDQERVIVAMRIENFDLDVARTEHFFQHMYAILELAVQDPVVQVTGVVAVLDYTDFTLRHARIITPSFARAFARIVQIHLHGSDMSTLVAMVPARVLPESLGGCGPGWNFAAYRAGVARNEALVREWHRYGYGMKETEDSTTSSRQTGGPRTESPS